MGAFFFALIGLLCVAGGKAYNSAIIKSDNAEKQRIKYVCENEYKDLRLKSPEHIIWQEFKSLGIEKITELLGGDFGYITGETCDKEYFRQAVSEADTKGGHYYQKTLLLVWLSQNGFVDDVFAKYFETVHWISVFATVPAVTGSMLNPDCEKMIRKKCNDLRLRTFKVIERNLRRKYHNIRIVFVRPERDNKPVGMEGFDWYNIYFAHECNMSHPVRLWDDSETDPNLK